MLDLQRLEHFRVLASHQSYTAAAAALHVSQPTLTRSIQGLEKSLNARLLDRGRNGVELTDVGLELLHHAHSLAQHVTSIEADISMRSQGMRGHVNIGLGPNIGGMILPSVISEIVDSEHDITLRATLSPATEMYAMTLNGELDFFVSRMPNPSWLEKLDVLPIGMARTEFFVRPAHPLAAKKRVKLADVLEYQRICGTAWNEVLASSSADQDIPPLEASIEVDDSGVLARAVHDADLILVGMNQEPAASGLVRLAISDRKQLFPGAPVTLNRPTHRSLSPAGRFVLRIVLAHAYAIFGGPGTAPPPELD
ncbi:LysR family transcriptional regulator [Leucobacter allii]|uniref:LysR family transcriptional regulator n=1 Tax=Leucobacter allii TaxID=2932247 RepID=A0ABY4FMP1_9MICO|nr:LysR family transcriptional regulator [Leucobacter allii]UOQ57526.1 LysR family transcriptional regulator [Leucobacter allii]